MRGKCDACGLDADCYFTTAKFAVPEHVERRKSIQQRISDLRKRIVEIEVDLHNSEEGLKHCPESTGVFLSQLKCCQTALTELRARQGVLEADLERLSTMRN